MTTRKQKEIYKIQISRNGFQNIWFWFGNLVILDTLIFNKIKRVLYLNYSCYYCITLCYIFQTSYGFMLERKFINPLKNNGLLIGTPNIVQKRKVNNWDYEFSKTIAGLIRYAIFNFNPCMPKEIRNIQKFANDCFVS